MPQNLVQMVGYAVMDMMNSLVSVHSSLVVMTAALNSELVSPHLVRMRENAL